MTPPIMGSLNKASAQSSCTSGVLLARATSSLRRGRSPVLPPRPCAATWANVSACVPKLENGTKRSMSAGAHTVCDAYALA